MATRLVKDPGVNHGQEATEKVSKPDLSVLSLHCVEPKDSQVNQALEILAPSESHHLIWVDGS